LLNGIFDTLNGIFDTLSGIFGTLNGIFGTLNGIFDTWPMVGDDAVPPHDALSLPGSYHTIFSLSYVTKMQAEFNKVKEEMQAEFDKVKEEMQAELDKAKEEVKDAWNSAAATGELLEKEFEERLREAGDREAGDREAGDHGIDIDALRTQIDFLKYDLKAAKGAAEHYQNELDKLKRAATKVLLGHTGPILVRKVRRPHF
jgi:hypothetical protein